MEDSTLWQLMVCNGGVFVGGAGLLIGLWLGFWLGRGDRRKRKKK